MSMYSRFFAGLGRTLISIIFIVVALSEIFYWEQADKDLSYALTNWELYTGDADKVGEVFTTMTSMTSILLVVAIALQLIGGVFLFFNYRVRFAAFLLIIYLMASTVLYHPFWYLEGQAFSRTLVLFLNNIAIVGGLLVVLSMGKGITRLKRVRMKRSVRSDEMNDDYDQE